MVHRWDILLLGFGSGMIRIKILGVLCMLWDLFQGIDIPVVYAGIEVPVKCLDHHYLCPLLRVYLFFS